MLGLRAPQAGVLGLGARGLQLRLRLLHVGHGRGAALVEILRQLQRAGIVDDRLVEQLCSTSSPRSVK